MAKQKNPSGKNPLMQFPQYQYEEWDEETSVLSIGIGTLVFVTVHESQIWGWQAVTQRGRVVVVGEGSWKRASGAEKAMRKFIVSILTVAARR